ncbi:hypothetical protein [Streptomyces caeruleatus]|uniref:hypothetical protein n=1 Tax=Streptomyces caeruleatus TaxID=661399 RepID=UPI003CC53EC5
MAPGGSVRVRRLHNGGSVLVVANNIRQAQQLYGHLGPIARQLFGPQAAAMLHSRFERRDRRRLEQHITELISPSRKEPVVICPGGVCRRSRNSPGGGCGGV